MEIKTLARDGEGELRPLSYQEPSGYALPPLEGQEVKKNNNYSDDADSGDFIPITIKGSITSCVTPY